MKGGSKVVVEPHRHEGIFIAKGKEDAFVTKNLVPGEAVYNEKRVTVQVFPFSSLDVCALNLFSSFQISSCRLSLTYMFMCCNQSFCSYFTRQ